MSVKAEFDYDAEHEMLQYVDMNSGQSDLEFSEDGGSSIASSADFPFESLDHGEHMEHYNMTGTNMEGFNMIPVQSPADMNISAALPVIGDETTDELMERLTFAAPQELKNIDTQSQGVDLWFLGQRDDPTPMEYRLDIEDFPDRSRVETQIKCRFSIRNAISGLPPTEKLLHLPADTIARPRFRLLDEEQLRRDPDLYGSTLWLSVDAINQDAPRDRVLMCTKCLAREQKRAFRKKSMDPHEEAYWGQQQSRRIIIFNCKEVVPIRADGNVELPLRVACYCRHHAAKNGYRLVFTLRDGNNRTLGRALSSKIFITDNHKEQRKLSNSNSASASASVSASASATSSGVESSQESFVLSRGTPHHRSSSTSLNKMGQRHPYMRPSKAGPSVGGAGPGPNVGPPAGGGPGGFQFPSKQLNEQVVQRSWSVPSWVAGIPNQTQPPSDQQVPVVFRAIPPSGSVRGGIEVTLLGQNFRPGMTAMFGDAPAVTTQCWSDSTIVAHLPVSNQTGPVPVTFQGQDPLPVGVSPAIFTYVNDGEDKLKEIALQMIGYKMTGKIEDAGNIAQRIVVNDDKSESERRRSSNPGMGESAENTALWVLKNLNNIAPERMSNVNLRNTEGQTMLHLAAILGYASVVKALLAKGAYVDIQDVSGVTPLHFAVLFGNRNITRLLLQVDADPFNRTLLGQTALDLADSTVEDLLPKDQRSWFAELNRRGSSSSLANLVQEWELEEARSDPHSLPTPFMPTPDATDADSTRDDAESEAESSEGDEPVARAIEIPRRPPSYSQLFPGGDGYTKARKPNRVLMRRSGNSAAPVIDIEVSDSDDGGDVGEEDELDFDGNNDNADDEGTFYPAWFEKLSTRSVDLRHDRMLFTFWGPLALFAVTAILAIYAARHNGGDTHVAAFVTLVTKSVTSWAEHIVDRFLPTAERAQTISRFSRSR